MCCVLGKSLREMYCVGAVCVGVMHTVKREVVGRFFLCFPGDRG